MGVHYILYIISIC